MHKTICLAWLLYFVAAVTASAAETPVMQGVPPSPDSQATFHNYRDNPYSQWTFRNAGAPLHVVMIPRQGAMHSFDRPRRSPPGDMAKFDDVFRKNYGDGVVVIQGNKILHEKYFHGFSEHAQHIWFSMTKSLASAGFGLLVEQGKVDLQASPAHYIPELKMSGFARVTIQQVLDHASAIDFKESYTDPTSDFFQFYAPALNMGWLPGAADAQPADTEIYGVHDFLEKFVKADASLQPGAAFDYNSSNADLLGWLIARISGLSFQDFVQQNIWGKLGTEHDAYIAVDRAYMPVVTGGMNSTLRDAARFGMMIRDQGKFAGKQVIPAAWTRQILELSPSLINNMKKNPKYSGDPWQAYHNMWWLLDAEKGEFCAVGIHGQVIYVNRSANVVMAWFSSQPVASAASNPRFHAKLAAARGLAERLH